MLAINHSNFKLIKGIVPQLILDSNRSKGDSYFNEFLNFALDIPTSCSILFTDFRTVFVFALGRFVHIVVNFYEHWYFKTVKMAKKVLNLKIGQKPFQKW